MLSDVDDLLDRYEQPRFRGALPVPPARSASATNPRCGDRVTLYVELDGDQVVRVRFEGAGCTISQVGADIAAELAQGQGRQVIEALQLQAVLARLGPVRTRLDCAGLGLRTLQRLLASSA